ncbi:MAG TPA: c-type cytochrome [Chitinophagales bacterium]|jgi:cytochrome c oxidase cbb3-type subunit 3|nr:c-type cytochrome [Chitinophagales bacterium]HQV78090.1 c-type cytochrome [Chitinophagales bacterium]HQW80097.1 c-type cytochrome [Chitinophagales bacterium]HRB66863.1 c-type cytochrome [Chitinophagales bacterium]HRB69105.1 c-type cytochrome [Chitinophagales bacterium]
MKKQLINFLSVLILLFISSSSIIAQEAVATATSIAKNDTSSISLSVNTVLCIIACVLLLIIIVLATTVSSAIDLFKANKKTFKNISVFIGLLMVSALTFAQEPAAAESVKSVATEASASVKSTIYFYAFILIILIEIAIILYFIKMLKFLTGIDQLKKSNDIKELTLWEKFNQLKSIEEEGEIDLGHDYDGIRELDNITPPWFTIAFALSIVAAGIYYYRFEIGHTALTQEQEFEIEMREAKILQDSLLKLEGNQVDENNVAMLDAAGIASGMKLYNTNCGACHGDKGQGGVGPNLTDAYWLHGGSISHVFKSIKYGIVDKGMKSWKEDFSPTQIAQLASFIESIQGTNPPGAKEKQGDLYVASESNATPSDSTKN